MNTGHSDLDQSLWDLASSIAGWETPSSATALLTIRWMGLAGFAPGVGSSMVSLRFRMALAVMLAALMAGGQSDVKSVHEGPYHEVAFLLCIEFVIGVILGLCVSLWIAAARSAGEWIALLAGLKVQTTYQPDWDGDAGESPSPVGRLFALLGMVVFFTGRGPLRLLDLMRASLEACPLGHGLAPLSQAKAESAFALLGEALSLSILAAWPIIMALSTAQLAVALATRTQSVALSWSLLAPTRLAVGMLILATGFASVTPGLTRSLDNWSLSVSETLRLMTAPPDHQPERNAERSVLEGAEPQDGIDDPIENRNSEIIKDEESLRP